MRLGEAGALDEEPGGQQHSPLMCAQRSAQSWPSCLLNTYESHRQAGQGAGVTNTADTRRPKHREPGRCPPQLDWTDRAPVSTDMKLGMLTDKRPESRVSPGTCLSI